MSKEILTDLALILLVVFVAFLFGGVTGVKQMQRRAIVEGHAEYIVDSDGEKHFRWKTNCDH